MLSLPLIGRKQLAYRFNFTYRYIDDVSFINNQEFENYLGQIYPVEFEIKIATKSYTSASDLDLLLSIEKNDHFHTLPFMTKVTSKMSTSFTFRSWVTTVHLHPPFASLSNSIYDMPVFTCNIDVIFRCNMTFKYAFRAKIRQGTLSIPL